MITMLFLCFSAFAETGRVSAAAWFGASPGSGFAARGGVDYGVIRHLTIAGEAGWGGPAVTLAAGPRLDAIDSHWWRVGVVAMPGIAFARGEHQPPTAVLDVGARASWLAFWGVSLVARADRLQTLDSQGWTELGLGIGVRL